MSWRNLAGQLVVCPETGFAESLDVAGHEHAQIVFGDGRAGDVAQGVEQVIVEQKGVPVRA